MAIYTLYQKILNMKNVGFIYNPNNERDKMEDYISRKVEDSLVFYFEGELNTLKCLKIENNVMAEIKEHNGKVVFDMEKVNYIASSFIRLCGSAAYVVGGDNISLINLKKEIKKLLKKVGLASALKVK
jgi:anti-anti-sigma factor